MTMSDLEERARDRLVDLLGLEGLESIGDESYVARIRMLSGGRRNGRTIRWERV